MLILCSKVYFIYLGFRCMVTWSLCNERLLCIILVDWHFPSVMHLDVFFFSPVVVVVVLVFQDLLDFVWMANSLLWAWRGRYVIALECICVSHSKKMWYGVHLKHFSLVSILYIFNFLFTFIFSCNYFWFFLYLLVAC